MLTELHIRDFALIQRLTLEFGRGLNVLTGETGAGKSIIIDAIGSVLGERAGSEFVRSGANKARIEATFEIPEGASPTASEPLSSAGSDAFSVPGGLEESTDPGGLEESTEDALSPELLAEDGLLLIAREISRSGRSGIRLNGRPATLAMARQVTDRLVDIHGQHDHQSMLRQEHHVDILDQWAGREPLKAREAVERTHRKWNELQRERNRLVLDEKERIRRLDLLRFQVEEIDAARPQAGEENELLVDRSRLAGASKLFASAAETMALLCEDERNVVEDLGVASARLREALLLDPSIEPILQNVETALFTLEEAVRDLDGYRDGIEFNPDRLAEVEERLDLLRGLKRKYGSSAEEILAYREEAAGEIALLEHAEERSQELDESIAAAFADLEARCRLLTRLRHAAAPDLERSLMRELADLGMAKARFKVQMEPMTPGPTGAERIEFLLSANPGEPLKPLARVASGGELSRIMLALKSVSARAGGVPVMIFDEVDVGVGGRTGTTLAAKLRALGDHSQVLCVTHLPQIAAAAHRHFTIQKQEQDGRTLVHVAEVTGEDRVVELARMLGGGEGAAMQHARELLRNYETVRI